MQQPLISIVLPTYNGARYIRQSIESCLAQTFADFELIIVNDCSTDETGQLAAGYAAKDQRVRVIHNETNRRLPLSLNIGFQQAKGKFFTWTSDDNIYAPGALQAMLNVLLSHTETDLVYSDYSLINEAGEVTGTKIFGDINKSFHHWLGCGACFLYRKEVHFQNNGYNPAAFLIEDYDFFVRAFLKFRFHYLPGTDLYFYREHGGSLTATQHAIINDISKIFLERNIPGLERKLPQPETALLYRKFAVYYGVSKNNSVKYREYLRKLSHVSVYQSVLAVVFVFFQKLVSWFTIGWAGPFHLLVSLFEKKDSGGKQSVRPDD